MSIERGGIDALDFAAKPGNEVCTECDWVSSVYYAYCVYCVLLSLTLLAAAQGWQDSGNEGRQEEEQRLVPLGAAV